MDNNNHSRAFQDECTPRDDIEISIKTKDTRAIGSNELLHRSINIAVDQEYFDYINDTAITYARSQMSVGEIAAADETEAYNYIRQVIGNTASKRALSVDVNGVSNRDPESIESTRMEAERTIFTVLPPSFEIPLDVKLYVRPSLFDVEMGMTDDIPVVELRLNPDLN